jgi:hypothetical protein
MENLAVDTQNELPVNQAATLDFISILQTLRDSNGGMAVVCAELPNSSPICAGEKVSLLPYYMTHADKMTPQLGVYKVIVGDSTYMLHTTPLSTEPGLAYQLQIGTKGNMHHASIDEEQSFALLCAQLHHMYAPQMDQIKAKAAEAQEQRSHSWRGKLLEWLLKRSAYYPANSATSSEILTHAQI